MNLSNGMAFPGRLQGVAETTLALMSEPGFPPSVLSSCVIL